MSLHPLSLYSNGFRLDADLHAPDDDGDGRPYPVVIACSGFQGLKVIHPERFARALTPLGYAVLAFNYRGQGDSEGERGRLVPQDEVEDVRAAVDRLTGVTEVDADRLALLGWGMGGGVVVAEAADDPRVRAVVAINSIGDGARSTRNMHDDSSWNSLLARIAEDRVRRTTLGRSEVTSPWDIVRLDLDKETDRYVKDELYKASGFGWGVTLESADYLLRFSPESVVGRIAPRPVLIIHGTNNELHRLEEAETLYERAREPKTLIRLEGHGHTEWMFDDHPIFGSVISSVDEFLRAAGLVSAPPDVVGPESPVRAQERRG
jgi:fermentation-respiration switch protein FrsA (DUF1100 family)